MLVLLSLVLGLLLVVLVLLLLVCSSASVMVTGCGYWWFVSFSVIGGVLVVWCESV